MKQEFDKYMDNFKTLPLKEKKDICLEQLKLIAGLTNSMCSELDVQNEVLVTTDITEAYNSEDDFVEAVVVYLNSIQNSLCDFTNALTDYMEKNS